MSKNKTYSVTVYLDGKPEENFTTEARSRNEAAFAIGFEFAQIYPDFVLNSHRIDIRIF